MSATDGIKHIVDLVVGRTIEPEFAHRQVGVTEMCHTIAHHSGTYILGRKLATHLLGILSQFVKENVFYQFVDSQPNITEDAFGSLFIYNRETDHQGKIVNNAISTPSLELIGEIGTPVLATTFP